MRRVATAEYYKAGDLQRAISILEDLSQLATDRSAMATEHLENIKAMEVKLGSGVVQIVNRGILHRDAVEWLTTISWQNPEWSVIAQDAEDLRAALLIEASPNAVASALQFAKFKLELLRSDIESECPRSVVDWIDSADSGKLPNIIRFRNFWDFFANLFLESREVDDFLELQEECFAKDLRRYGQRRAKFLYGKRAVCSLRPQLQWALHRLMAFEAIRRLFH